MSPSVGYSRQSSRSRGVVSLQARCLSHYTMRVTVVHYSLRQVSVSVLPCCMQAQFLAGQSGSQPAARVTRVSRKSPAVQQPLQQPPSNVESHSDANAPLAQAVQQQQPPGPAQAQKAPDASAGKAASTAADQDDQLCPSIPGILTSVKERETGPVIAPGGPAAAAESAFPKAVHRKQSKVGWHVGIQSSLATKPCRSTV